MSRELTGKRAILTGASGGIGRATAEALVKAGVRVALASRNAGALNELARSLQAHGGDVIVVPTDITKPDDRQRLVDTTVEKFGGLDLLINNAGVGSWGHFATSTPEIMRQVMEVNFFGPVELTRLAIPHLTNGNRAGGGERHVDVRPQGDAGVARVLGQQVRAGRHVRGVARRVRPLRRRRASPSCRA